MTIIQYANKSNKSIETILRWIYEGRVPGASVDHDYVPDSARTPLTKTRAKTAEAIYWSIVKASNEKKHVTHHTYKLCKDEFNCYIEQLINAGLIVKRKTDGVIYYEATPLAFDKKKAFILDCIERTSRGAAQGVTAAIIEANKA